MNGGYRAVAVWVARRGEVASVVSQPLVRSPAGGHSEFHVTTTAGRVLTFGLDFADGGSDAFVCGVRELSGTHAPLLTRAHGDVRGDGLYVSSRRPNSWIVTYFDIERQRVAFLDVRDPCWAWTQWLPNHRDNAAWHPYSVGLDGVLRITDWGTAVPAADRVIIQANYMGSDALAPTQYDERVFISEDALTGSWSDPTYKERFPLESGIAKVVDGESS